MNKILLIQSNYKANVITHLLQDYPEAINLHGKVPLERFENKTLIFAGADRASKQQLLSFLKQNLNNTIFLIANNIENVDYKIKNMCHT